MRTLIIGGSSKIGKYFKSKKYLKTYYKNTVKDGIYFDLARSNIIKIIDKYNITKIVLLSAISDPDECYNNKTLSNNLNVIFTIKLLKKIISKNIYFVFFSSEYIFDGLKGNYSEKSIPKPNNLYGKQKLKVENFIKKKTKNFTIFRIAKTYTDNLKDNTLISNHLKLIKKKVKSLYVAYDQKFNPLFVHDLIKITDFFLYHKIKGVYNVGGPEKISRFNAIRKINNTLGFQKKINIKKIKFSKFKLIEKRPLNVTMNCNKLFKVYNKKLTLIEGVVRKIAKNKN